MSDKGVIAAAVGLLIVTVAVGTVLGRFNRLPSRGSAPLPIRSLGNQPIMHIELPRDESDLRAVLSVGDQAANVRDVRTGNTIDSFLFIPAYAGLLAAIGVLLRRHSAARLRAIVVTALLLVPLIAACDWVENGGIGQTLDHFETSAGPHARDAARIAYPSLAKWLLLTLVLLVYGVAAVAEPPVWRRGIGVLLLVFAAVLTSTLARYGLQRWG
jgi:DMSO reductase anchor subunit